MSAAPRQSRLWTKPAPQALCRKKYRLCMPRWKRPVTSRTLQPPTLAPPSLPISPAMAPHEMCIRDRFLGGQCAKQQQPHHFLKHEAVVLVGFGGQSVNINAAVNQAARNGADGAFGQLFVTNNAGNIGNARQNTGAVRVAQAALNAKAVRNVGAVSYTHLDVYKRQPYTCYLQGGVNFTAGRAAVLNAVQKAFFA